MTTTATTKAPFDPKADVEARRAATAAKMDQAKGKDAAAKPAGAMGKATAADPTGTRAKREAASAKKVARPSKRTGGVDPKVARKAAARSGNPKKAAEAAESTRYTAPIPRAQLESPAWVPVLMFSLLGLGGLVVLLTYMLWEGRPLALGAGLALILGGILTATQYR